MPGPAILAASAAVTLVLSIEAPAPIMPPSVKEYCSKAQCVVMTVEQLEKVYHEGVKRGVERTIERMQVACLKDEA